jgi:hypothetical protein
MKRSECGEYDPWGWGSGSGACILPYADGHKSHTDGHVSWHDDSEAKKWILVESDEEMLDW